MLWYNDCNVCIHSSWGRSALLLPLNVIKQLDSRLKALYCFFLSVFSPFSHHFLLSPFFPPPESKRCRVACIKPSALIRPTGPDQTPARFLLTFCRFLLLTLEPDFSQPNLLYQCSPDSCLLLLCSPSPCSFQHGWDSNSPNSVW